MISKDSEDKGKWFDLGSDIKIKVILNPKLPNGRCPILDWEGLEENGKELPYSVEDAKRILKAYPDFATYIYGTMYEELSKEEDK